MVRISVTKLGGTTFCFLDRIEDGGLVALGARHDLALGGLHGHGALAFAVHVQKLAQVETRTLQDLCQKKGGCW